jgi:hypothetical protein
MKGRGIGTARGRATIMRGTYLLASACGLCTQTARTLLSLFGCDIFSKRYVHCSPGDPRKRTYVFRIFSQPAADVVFPNRPVVSGDELDWCYEYHWLPCKYQNVGVRVHVLPNNTVL